jgi:glycosyltransferase involved in cell wall biosynthesis
VQGVHEIFRGRTPEELELDRRMIRDQSIVCFANDWHSDPTSKHQIMKILSKRNRILWINSVGLRTPSFSSQDFSRILNKVKGLLAGIERINDNLYILTPLVIPFHKYTFVRKINRAILLFQIRYYLKRLRMKDIQLWTFIPSMADIGGKLGEKKLIYYCVDDWAKFSFIESDSIIQMETDLIKKSDLVIVSAKELYEQKKKLSSNTHLVLHGVDYEHFSKALDNNYPVPYDIGIIPKPIIGFFGLIHEWIDLSLIKEVASAHPDWSIVMIGKVSADITDLRKLSNVYFLGQKTYEDLPGYCKAFDVAIIPFVINDLTKSVNPIKLREYLAAGLPVVSVDLPEVRNYEKIIRISTSPGEFVRNIEKSLASDSLAEKYNRSRLMAREDWRSRISEIEGFLS